MQNDNLETPATELTRCKNHPGRRFHGQALLPRASAGGVNVGSSRCPQWARASVRLLALPGGGAIGGAGSDGGQVPGDAAIGGAAAVPSDEDVVASDPNAK